MSEKIEIIFPTVTFTSTLGEEFNVSEITLTMGFGTFVNAHLELHPKQFNNNKSTTFGSVLDILATAQSDAKKPQQGTVEISIENATTKDYVTIVLEGKITNLGHSSAYAAEPAYALDLVCNLAELSAFNPAIYALHPKVLSSGEVVDKNIIVSPKVRRAENVAEMAKYILEDLVSGYQPNAHDLSLKEKNSIHQANLVLMDDVNDMLTELTPYTGPEWKKLLGSADLNNLITRIYNALTNRTHDFVSNIASLYQMFGKMWYTDIDEIMTTGLCMFGSLSYNEYTEETANGTGYTGKAPHGIRYYPSTYPTAMRRPPTSVLVEASVRGPLLEANHTPTSLISCYPEASSDFNLFYKVNAPLWLPDGVSPLSIPYPPSSSPVDPDSIPAVVHKTEKLTKQNRTTLQVICDTWAEVIYNKVTLWNDRVQLVLPLDLTTRLGYYHTVMGDMGDARGIVTQIRHHIVTNKSATTTMTLSCVEFEGELDWD